MRLASFWTKNTKITSSLITRMLEQLTSTDFKFIIEPINYSPDEILRIFAYFAKIQ